ncbi:L,D-peptidoglycan transpeptidase YkuD, ErfK/YbiS/YcfS/YnhG family [Nakamurella panacisegetis]|uniref:L,D-peptidoglycan transpeptidase YkuD, ErfK/YbiS/YcfS/YnhG family n=1 Tax=Nakamurella panacisegetis TaxID=1090615 RepID=A0A1H0NHG8_9ACTN|nr:L,D-transpeptidase family protein [Nakamurella panacisegetis]SDO92134.1 L,D-peptidoglycan transpeptidase YkuD, ErfK/YbiS/YcfS/YnhG family [Nakamurella panacisegetis]
MVTTVALAAAGLVVVSVVTAPAASADASPAPANSRQIISVTAPTSGSTTAVLRAYQKGGDGIWHLVIGPVSAHVGQDGVGKASEGSGRTPAGAFALTQAFGRQPNPGTKVPYFRSTPLDWWDENPSSPTYNLHVRRATSPGGASENLYYSGSVYDYVVNMDYNLARVPGAGSAFFLHVSDGTPTAGCVSVPSASMVQILRWLDPSQHPYIYIKVGAAWRPPIPPTPVGRTDTLTAIAGGRLSITGWAVNPATPLIWMRIRVKVAGPKGSAFFSTTTGVPRPDVSKTYYWAGPRTGYRIVVPSMGAGTNQVCVAEIIAATGVARNIVCRAVTVR